MAGVKVEHGSLRESILVQARLRRERIEAMKVLAICTACVNPDKAGETFKDLVKMMFPEQKDMERVEMERKKKILEAYSDKAFLLTPMGGGMGAWRADLVDSQGRPVSDPLSDGSI